MGAIAKGVFTGIGALATATENVKGILENTGIISEDSKQETTTSSSSTPNSETTSPSTHDPQLAKQVQELTQRLESAESKLQTLDYNEQEMALKEIGEAYKQELSKYSPQEQELINQNFQYVAPERIAEVTKQWAAFNELWTGTRCTIGDCSAVDNIRVDD